MRLLHWDCIYSGTCKPSETLCAGSCYLTYDSDEAGTRAALRAVPILREAGL